MDCWTVDGKLFLKILKKSLLPGWGYSSKVEHLRGMHEALSSIPNTGTKDGRTEERRKQREGGREEGREGRRK